MHQNATIASVVNEEQIHLQCGFFCALNQVGWTFRTWKMICISEGSKSSSIQSFGAWSCMDWIYGHLDALRSIEPLETNTSFTPLHHRDKVADGSWLDGIHCGYLQDFVEMSPSSSCTRCYFSGRLYKKDGSFWVVFLGWLLFLGHFLDERFSPHIFERTKQPTTQRVGFWIGECFPRNIPNFLPEFSSRLRPVFGTWKTPQQFQTCERQEM